MLDNKIYVCMGFWGGFCVFFVGYIYTNLEKITISSTSPFFFFFFFFLTIQKSFCASILNCFCPRETIRTTLNILCIII